MDRSLRETRWTTKTLLNVVEKYVVRTRLSAKSKKELEDGRNEAIFSPQEAVPYLQRLMDKSEGKLDIYGPVEQLMNDITLLSHFQNNGEFLGLKDQFNYLGSPKYMQDTKRMEFMPKNDVYFLIFKNFSSFIDAGDEVHNLLLMSLGNAIFRQMKNSYEIIPTDIVDSVCSASTDVFNSCRSMQLMTRISKRGLKLSNHSVDEAYSIFSQFFDEKNDKELLVKLRQHLIEYNKTKPIGKHEEFYQALYLKLVLFQDAIGTLTNRFPMVFQPYSKIKKTLKTHYAVVRVFNEENNRFFLAKDLEFALTLALRNKFKNKNLAAGICPIETAEDKKRGILMSVDWKKFESILKTLGLTVDDLNIIEHDIERTSRNIAVPIITQYGTHCKLATDAFYEVFDNVSTGLQLFQTVNKQNVPKIFEWFSKLHDVFNDTRKTRYFIELWKIDEIVERVYKELEVYSTEKVYEISKKIEKFEKSEAIKQVLKMSPNFGLNPENVEAIHFYFLKTFGLENDISMRYVHKIYEHCVRLQFFAANPKYTKFMHNQGACGLMRRLVCECQKETQIPKTPINKMPEVLEMTREEYLEAVYIEYRNRFDFKLVAKNGKSYADNDCCLGIVMDSIVENAEENQREILKLSFNEEAKKEEMKNTRIFYFEESEIEKICEKSNKMYQDVIENAIDRVRAQKNSYLQTREIKWCDVRRGLYEMYPKSEKNGEIIDKVMKNLKTHPGATKNGILCNLMTEVFEVCRHAQMIYRLIFGELRSLTDYSKKKEKRKIVLRSMCEMKIEDQKEWHVFCDEVMEAFECILHEENRFAAMSQKLEKMEMKWYRAEKATIIKVSEFEKAMQELGIEKSKFTLVPDMFFARQIIELPLRMGYDAIHLRTPHKFSCIHYAQAQYLIFQRLACDINWDHNENIKARGKFREKILFEMRKVENDGEYWPFEQVELLIEKLMEEEYYQKERSKNDRTPLAICHEKRYNETISKSEFTAFLEQICHEKFAVTFRSALFLKLMGFDEETEKIEEIDAWKIRYVFMKYWIEKFFEDEPELKTNVLKAWTVSLAHVNLEKAEDFIKWQTTLSQMPNKFVNFDDFVLTMLTMQKNQENIPAYEEYQYLVSKHPWTILAESKTDKSTTKPEPPPPKTETSSTSSSISNPKKSDKPHKMFEKEGLDEETRENLERMFGDMFRDNPQMQNVQIVTDPKDIMKEDGGFEVEFRDEILGKMKIEGRPVEEKEEKKEIVKKSNLDEKAVERTLKNVFDNVNLVLHHISSQKFIEIQEFEDLVCEYYENVISIDDFKMLPKIIKEDLEKLKKKFENVFEFKTLNGKEVFRKIRKPGMHSKQCCGSESEAESEADSKSKSGTDSESDDEMELLRKLQEKFATITKLTEEKVEPKFEKQEKPEEKCENCEEYLKMIERNIENLNEYEKKIEEATKINEDFKKVFEDSTTKYEGLISALNRELELKDILIQRLNERIELESEYKKRNAEMENLK
ncbi:unnamed protein product [Caenorhabditis angaria]|uniref:DUF7809 domain-containing protein n=1 Tax=Caenorhabditis angaria TaxID=860376 RepID=A0A9P1I8D2_9PELO|nr:unnamed protein product [Caenorhabditis angaria]